MFSKHKKIDFNLLRTSQGVKIHHQKNKKNTQLRYLCKNERVSQIFKSMNASKSELWLKEK
jgi:hypothetical protein